MSLFTLSRFKVACNIESAMSLTVIAWKNATVTKMLNITNLN